MGNRSVAGIAFQSGSFFIARRLPGGDLGGKWEFPGGKAEAGESDGDALLREFREEFGVSAAAGDFLGCASFTHNEKKYELNAYRVFFDTDSLKLSEHSEWRWAGFDEIEKLDFAGSDLKLIPALKQVFPGKGEP